MRRVSVTASGTVVSLIAAMSGCLLDPDAGQVEDIQSSDELSISNENASDIAEATSDITIQSTPTCNWVASYAGAWVPFFNGNSDTVDCTLVRGSNNAAVRQLQHSMNLCYNEHLVEDGDFGTNTWNALKRTQVKALANADGQYGPLTRAKMRHEAVVTGPIGGGPCIRVP